MKLLFLTTVMLLALLNISVAQDNAYLDEVEVKKLPPFKKLQKDVELAGLRWLTQGQSKYLSTELVKTEKALASIEKVVVKKREEREASKNYLKKLESIKRNFRIYVPAMKSFVSIEDIHSNKISAKFLLEDNACDTAVDPSACRSELKKKFEIWSIAENEFDRTDERIYAAKKNINTLTDEGIDNNPQTDISQYEINKTNEYTKYIQDIKLLQVIDVKTDVEIAELIKNTPAGEWCPQTRVLENVIFETKYKRSKSKKMLVFEDVGSLTLIGKSYIKNATYMNCFDREKAWKMWRNGVYPAKRMDYTYDINGKPKTLILSYFSVSKDSKEESCNSNIGSPRTKIDKEYYLNEGCSFSYNHEKALTCTCIRDLEIVDQFNCKQTKYNK
jgi:DNA polymerase III alpha subunit (gram-positive type)